MTVGQKAVHILALWLMFWVVLLAQSFVKATRFKRSKMTKGGHKP